MSLMGRMREFLQRNIDNSTIVSAKATPAGSPFGIQDPNDSKLLSDEGYRKNVIIYACINLIARTASEPDLQVGTTNNDGDFEAADRTNASSPAMQLQELLDRPNREQSQYDWLERALIEMGYSGNSITHKMRPKARVSGRGPVAELWQLTPYRTKIVLNKETNLPGAYQFPTDIAGSGEQIPAEDIIHVKRHDPANEHWGLSPLAVAARVGDLDNMGTEYLRTMFHNLGEPSALLIFKEIKNRAQHQRARELWKETHGGPKGWHQVGTLDASVQWQEVGSRPNDMALEGVFSHSESRLCAAFGVPPILVAAWIGLLRSTYANYDTALKDLWTDTLVPMYTRLGDKLTHSLAVEYSEELVVRFDTSKVAALQDDRKDLREFALRAWEQSLLPRNRVLALADVDPVEDGVRGEAYKHEETTQPTPMQFEQPRRAIELETVSRETLKLPPPIWQTIDRMADNAAPIFASAFSTAVTNAHRDVSLMTIETALKNNDAPTAENAALRAWEDQLADLRSDYEPPLTKLFTKGGEVGDEQLARATVKLDNAPSEALNVSELEASEWVSDRVANLVAEVSQGTRNAIRVGVSQLAEGASVRSVAKGIRDRIGLTPRWIDFLEKKRAEGMSDAALAQLARQLLRRRAVNIAVNEARRAASEGQEFVWRRAVKRGIVKKNTTMFWITAGDDDVCEICEPMDGQERKLGELFETGIGTLVRLPPEPHNGCRCARGIRLKR